MFPVNFISDHRRVGMLSGIACIQAIGMAMGEAFALAFILAMILFEKVIILFFNHVTVIITVILVLSGKMLPTK